MSGRVTRLPEDVAELVDRVPDSDLAPCMYFLAITVLSGVDVADSAELATALTELRERGSVSAGHRLEVGSRLAQLEQRAFIAGRRGDDEARDRAFFQARAVNCLVHVVGAGSGAVIAREPRDRLREAAYEAAIAFRGTPAVVSVLNRYAG
ncbi:hypothetical protein [Gordonia hankookensis]|uniref:Uncharacterized protein n=1 Tax=Gordonia hankookensis TaxID=589403 RepID=A0ABR7WFY5_9ACTN|nr:hypothetical protein [Gordonia hankookensis]MBD1321671.1 hypothetical protein [Gordonia hankookensis]